MLRQSYSLPIIDRSAYVISHTLDYLIPADYSKLLKKHIKNHNQAFNQSKEKSDFDKNDLRILQELLEKEKINMDMIWLTSLGGFFIGGIVGFYIMKYKSYPIISALGQARSYQMDLEKKLQDLEGSWPEMTIDKATLLEQNNALSRDKDKLEMCVI